MLSNAMEISSSVSNPCQRKQRVLSLLLAASLQLALTTSDNSLRVAVMEQLSSEFGWDPMAQIALGDLLTHGVGVGVSVVVRDVVAPPRLISSGKRLSFSEVQVAIGHYTSAIAVLSNGSFVSSLLRSQPHHPLSLQGLHWNLCGCSICHSNCSWLDVQAASSLPYPVALRVGASFRLAWFLAEKGTTNTALQAFVSANTTVAEVAVDAYSTVVRKLIAIGHSAVLQETTAILEAISHISQRLDDACTKFHPLRSAVDVCDAIVYQQLAVMLHKRVSTLCRSKLHGVVLCNLFCCAGRVSTTTPNPSSEFPQSYPVPNETPLLTFALHHFNFQVSVCDWLGQASLACPSTASLAGEPISVPQTSSLSLSQTVGI